jgi:hypothetical protein
MTSLQLARDIARWIKPYPFCGHVSVAWQLESYSISFEARTTKTRASSIVTRIRLIAANLADESRCRVEKQLWSEAPRKREDLATWMICATVSAKRRLAPRSAA